MVKTPDSWYDIADTISACRIQGWPSKRYELGSNDIDRVVRYMCAQTPKWKRCGHYPVPSTLFLQYEDGVTYWQPNIY